jgi:hypothetical protein
VLTIVVRRGAGTSLTAVPRMQRSWTLQRVTAGPGISRFRPYRAHAWSRCSIGALTWGGRLTSSSKAP